MNQNKSPVKKIQSYISFLSKIQTQFSEFQNYSLRTSQKTFYFPRNESSNSLDISNDFCPDFDFKQIIPLEMIFSSEFEEHWRILTQNTKTPSILKIFEFPITYLEDSKKNAHLKRFLNEVEILKYAQSLKTEGVLNLQHFSFKKNNTKLKLYLILEYGFTSLTDILSFRLDYNEPEINYIFKQILTILLCLKEIGISHNNLKLDNIILLRKDSNLEEFSYKLFDFSLAFWKKLENYEFQGITKDYSSPERAKNQKNIDYYQSDIYSLAIIGLNLMGTSLYTLKTPRKYIKKYPFIFPIILEMMNNNPEKRPSLEKLLNLVSNSINSPEAIPNESEFYNKISLEIKKTIPLQEKISEYQNLLKIYYQDLKNYEKSLEIALKGHDTLMEILKQFSEPEDKRKYQQKLGYFLDMLGFFYKERKEWSNSLLYYTKSLNLKEEIFNENDEEISLSLQHLAEVQNLLEQKENSLISYERALQIHMNLFGVKNPTTGLIYYNIGLLLTSLGENEKAIENYERSLKIYEKLEHKNNEIIFNLCKDLTDLYDILKMYDKSLNYLEKCLTMPELKSEETLLCLNKMAKIYRKLLDYNKCIELYDKLLKMTEEVYGEKSEFYLACLNQIAEIHYKCGNLKKTIEYQEKSLFCLVSLYGENHNIIASTLRNIAEVSISLNNYHEALSFYEKALKIYENIEGFLEDKSQIYEKIANIYEREENIVLERINLEKAIEIWDLKKIEGNEKKAVLLNRLGNIYYQEDQLEKAKEVLGKALEINKKIMGEKDPSNEIYQENLEMVTRNLKINQK